MTAIITRYLKRFAPLGGLLFVFLLFVFLTPPAFYSFYNIKTILTQSVIVGIAAIGMTYVIISRGIDLSAGSLIALGTVVVALILNYLGGGPWVALIGAVAACTFAGWISGIVVARLRIIPFIATLGMMQVARGIAKWLGKEQTFSAPTSWINSLMLVDPSPSWLLFAPGVWICIALVFLSGLLLNKTVFGRYTFAIGSNEQTARLCGINVERIKVLIYALCGFFTGIAAIMQYANLTVGDPTAAMGMELDIIAAVVIGGASLSGGEGTIGGSIIGALIMAILRNGCNMVGIPNYVQEIMIGLIIIGAVLIDQMRHRLK